MFVGDRTTASASLAGAAAVVQTYGLLCSPVSGFVAIDDGCYAVIASKFNWFAANDACKTLHKDAHLVLMTSPQQREAVLSVIAHLGINHSFLLLRIIVRSPTNMAAADVAAVEGSGNLQIRLTHSIYSSLHSPQHRSTAI